MKNMVGNDELFSIAIITYQQRYILEDCLKSVFNQSYSNIELIVCDDHSCDFDVEEVRAFIEKHKKSNIKNIIVYQQPENVGTSANCQKALELSNGVFVKFQAGDDMLRNKNTLKEVAELFKRHNANVLITRAQACEPDGTLLDTKYPPDGHFTQAMKATPKQLFAMIGTQPWGAFVCAPAVFFRREYLVQIGGYDLEYKFTEDWPLWLKICEKGDQLTYIDIVTVIYRMGGISNDLSYVNASLGTAHYQECIRLLQDYVYPRLKGYSWLERLRCKSSINCIKARIIKEKNWYIWSFEKKLVWKIKNIPFFIISGLYRLRNRKQNIYFKSEQKFILLMAILYYFSIPIYSGYPIQEIWLSLLLLGIIVVGVKCLWILMIKLMNGILNKRMNRGH